MVEYECHSFTLEKELIEDLEQLFCLQGEGEDQRQHGLLVRIVAVVNHDTPKFGLYCKVPTDDNSAKEAILTLDPNPCIHASILPLSSSPSIPSSAFPSLARYHSLSNLDMRTHAICHHPPSDNDVHQ